MNLEELVEPITELAIEAGNAILAVYATDFDVESKSDESFPKKTGCLSLQFVANGVATGLSIHSTAPRSSSIATANSLSTSR